MKMTKEVAIPVVLGAVPVLIVIALAGFMAMSAPRHLTTPSNQPSSPILIIPSSGSTPTSSQPSSSTSGSGTSSSGGSSPFCLPLLGCS
ncbi:MAG: hypothetical protein KGI38_07780 [Thaumarchaeota archaeon]|nr:hypothetical protein [Nitrososphaerota archaeon]